MESPQRLPVEMRLSLRRGTVYYCQHRELSSSEPHYLIVLNENPLRDSVVVLAVASSQVSKVMARRANLPQETIVVVAVGDCSNFSKETAIDCNNLVEFSREELVKHFTSKTLTHKDDMPKEILSLLVAGVVASPLVAEEIKDLVQAAAE